MKQVSAVPDTMSVEGEPSSPILTDAEVDRVLSIASVGEVRRDFELMGHHFTMHALSERELIEVSSYSAAFSGTRAGNMAFRMYAVAAAIDLVDGKPLYQPLSPSEEDTLAKRGDEIGKWYPAVVDALYSEYVDITRESDSLIDKLKKS